MIPNEPKILGQLVTNGELLELVSKVPRKKKGHQFLKGPVPMWWLEEAALASQKAALLGVLLWFAAGIQKRWQVSLTGPLLKRFGFTRKPAYHHLKTLERERLVVVSRRRGKAPLVTILRKEVSA